jgi:hypothetical protein
VDAQARAGVAFGRVKYGYVQGWYEVLYDGHERHNPGADGSGGGDPRALVDITLHSFPGGF